MQRNNSPVMSNLEKNIYNFYITIAESTGRGINTGKSIKCVNTHPSCWPNYIFDAKFAQNRIKDEVELLKQRIRTGTVPNSWFIGPGSASVFLPESPEQFGFTKAFSWPGMSITIGEMNSQFQVSDDFIINEVKNMDSLNQWSDIINTGMFGYGFEGVNLFKNLLGKKDIKLFLGFFNDLPVSTSLMYLNSGVAGLFLISTLPDFRRRGFGIQLTLAPVKKAFEYGYEYAGLFATSSGERIYKKIGFHKICDFDIYYL
jgi:hypothetical protein